MARVCQLSGKKVMVGNNVSHSKRRTKRKFFPNLIRKRFYVESEDKWLILRICTSELRTINKIGIDAAIARSKAAGKYTA
ncbi:MAG: large subunit ribosomal protein L28 [Flavobacteriales bacterium]|jgi:large subunit ribosomal protein L28